MKKVQQGFTLIELLFVLAIIAILAAVAVPAYQDYTNSKKVDELILAGDDAKMNIDEYAQTNSTLTGSGAGQNVAGQYVATTSAVSDDGVITINGEGFPEPQPMVTLTPAIGEDGAVTWDCTGTPPNLMPESCKE